MAIRFDEARQAVFLKHLTETLNASAATRAAGVSKTSVFTLRREDEAFAKQWEDALEEGLDRAEESCNDRAFKGVEEPVFYKGALAGVWLDADGHPVSEGPEGFAKAVTFKPHYIRRFSDGLAQFMLKAHRPERFRDKLDVKVEGELTVVDRILAARKRVGGS